MHENLCIIAASLDVEF